MTRHQFFEFAAWLWSSERKSAMTPKRRLPVLKTFKGLGVKISLQEKAEPFWLINWQSKILVKTRLNKTKTLNAMFTFWWEALSSCGGMAYLSSVTPSLLQLLHLWLDLKSRRVLLPNSPKSTFHKHNSCCTRHCQSKNYHQQLIFHKAHPDWSISYPTSNQVDETSHCKSIYVYQTIKVIFRSQACK